MSTLGGGKSTQVIRSGESFFHFDAIFGDIVEVRGWEDVEVIYTQTSHPLLRGRACVTTLRLSIGSRVQNNIGRLGEQHSRLASRFLESRTSWQRHQSLVCSFFWKNRKCRDDIEEESRGVERFIYLTRRRDNIHGLNF